MKEFDKNTVYKIGKLKRGSVPNSPIFDGNPIVVYGDELRSADIKTDRDFFTKNTYGLKVGITHYIYELTEGNLKYFSEGTPRLMNAQGLGEIPQAHTERTLLAQQRADATRVKFETDSLALSILKDELTSKNEFIVLLQKQFTEKESSYQHELADLRKEIIMLNAIKAKLEEEVAMNKTLREKEEGMRDEYEKLAIAEGKKMAKEQGMSGVAETANALLPLIGMFLGGNNGNQQPQLNVPPPNTPPQVQMIGQPQTNGVLQ